MSMETPHGAILLSADILRGTKDYIIKFLADEKNLKQLTGYAAMLSERLDKE